MENIKDCFYCKQKWKCYDRLMKGRIIPCETEEEKRKQLTNYKWWDFFVESPQERQRARENYIAFCEMKWEE